VTLTHAEFVHETPQLTPHPPQLPFSVSSTHVSFGHGLKPELHVNPQLAPSQVAVAFVGGLQALQDVVPHDMIDVFLSQTPLQLCVPPGQTQALFRQVVPLLQTWPQVPQFCESLVEFVQVLSHLVGAAAEQPETHA
jgi:hypothetical protein